MFATRNFGRINSFWLKNYLPLSLDSLLEYRSIINVSMRYSSAISDAIYESDYAICESPHEEYRYGVQHTKRDLRIRAIRAG